MKLGLHVLPFLFFPNSILQALCQPSNHKFITGFAFLDSNNNGIRDLNEKGIEGISTSNGKGVVLTGLGGKWVLPFNNTQAVFVIKPARCNVPLKQFSAGTILLETITVTGMQKQMTKEMKHLNVFLAIVLMPLNMGRLYL